MTKFQAPDRDIADLHAAFAQAEPFRFIIIDDFLPAAQYKAASRAFPGLDAPMWLQYRSGRENKKLQSQNFDSVDSQLSDVLEMLNDPQFVGWLEKVTDIADLIPDPEYHGGGLHQTLADGHLGMHVDYNRHATNGLHRRLNAILYFNDTWDESWGGHLEFWTDGVKERAHRIAPIGNRLVFFETTETSWHGHPDPLTPSAGITRKSIAAYYYTKERPAAEIAPEHNTVFQARPGERFSVTPRERIGKIVRWALDRS